MASAIVIVSSATTTYFASSAGAADPAGPCYGCNVGKNIYVGLSKKETAGLPRSGTVTIKGKKHVVPYEYRIPLACSANSPERDDEVGCEKAFKTCVDVKDAEGPLVSVFQRPRLPKGHRAIWTKINETCWPKLVPGAKQKPQLTVAMIKSEFIKTPFTKPQVSMQPVGNRTLVNLPTYFKADFSGAGYGPGEVRTVTLLGHKVQIKPVLKSNTFRFGDGASLGPTKSSGGVYPDGDVRHTYLNRGTVGPSITTVYGGQFAIDGGTFTDLPGTATITGPVQQLQVLEAESRLVR